MDSSADKEGLHPDLDPETAVPSQHDVDELDEGQLALDDDDDDLDLDADEEITEDEAERADGA
jgi:hypothetical protein